MSRRLAHTLFIDADDTLWENNVHFEEVVGQYCALVESRGHTAEAARATLLAIERRRTKTDGYGIRNFRNSLIEACRQLLGDDEHADEAAAIDALCASIARQTVELLPGVAATLRELSGRHRLILLTKGDPDDQWRKLHRSGLRHFLHQVDVVREKDTEAYRDAIARHGVQPARGWMIGNSPRSDVLPALEAGLGVVFIPHPMTWALEMAEVPHAPGDRFLQLDRFEQLAHYF